MLALRYRELSSGIRAAWSARTPGEHVTAPWGQCSATDAIRGLTIETLVHGWDLAVATNQPSEAPAGLVNAVIAHVDRVIPKQPGRGCTARSNRRRPMPDRPNS